MQVRNEMEDGSGEAQSLQCLQDAATGRGVGRGAQGLRRRRERESTEEFVRSVNRLDPSMVIELSATPNRGISNLLVDITGVELRQEEMIKLPVQVKSSTNADWHNTLAEGPRRAGAAE